MDNLLRISPDYGRKLDHRPAQIRDHLDAYRAHFQALANKIAGKQGQSTDAPTTIGVEELKRLLEYCGIDVTRAGILEDLAELAKDSDCTGADGLIDLHEFIDAAREDHVFTKALTSSLAVDNWPEFVSEIVEIFETVKALPNHRLPANGGANASYVDSHPSQEPFRW